MQISDALKNAHDQNEQTIINLTCIIINKNLLKEAFCLKEGHIQRVDGMDMNIFRQELQTVSFSKMKVTGT